MVISIFKQLVSYRLYNNSLKLCIIAFYVMVVFFQF